MVWQQIENTPSKLTVNLELQILFSLNFILFFITIKAYVVAAAADDDDDDDDDAAAAVATITITTITVTSSTLIIEFSFKFEMYVVSCSDRSPTLASLLVCVPTEKKCWL
jgi:hypothetical protein